MVPQQLLGVPRPRGACNPLEWEPRAGVDPDDAQQVRGVQLRAFSGPAR